MLRTCVFTLACAELAPAEPSFLPLPSFAAEVRDLHISDLVRRSQGSESEQASAKEDIDKLHKALHEHRVLVFRGLGRLPWQDQVSFTGFFGKVFNESAHSNRVPHPAIPDPRVAIFSNDASQGLISVGTEGWHVDGNVVTNPHAITFIHAIAAIPDGDTMFAPLREVVEVLRQRGYLSGRCKERAPPCIGNTSAPADRDTTMPPLDDVLFQSGHVDHIRHPLIYPHPITGLDTMMFGLGKLSGRYRRGCLQPALPNSLEMSQADTDKVTNAIEDAIYASRRILRWRWASGDLLMVDNMAVAHYASDGSQAPLEQAGLRLMQRTTATGIHAPQKRPLLHTLPHECTRQEDGEPGLSNHYCVFSLSGLIHYETGNFDSRDAARERCRRLSPDADLAIPSTPRHNVAMGHVVSAVGKPHWIGGTDNPNGVVTWFDGSSASEGWGSNTSLPWHEPSGQPNDCDGPGSETCIFMGPDAKWFDFACQPKVADSTKGITPGPEIAWSGANKTMFDIHVLCGMHIYDDEATKIGLRVEL